MDERREVLVNRMRHMERVIEHHFGDGWEPPVDAIEVQQDNFLRRYLEGLKKSLAHEDELAARERGTPPGRS
jgi:hypothetical protein